MTDEQKKYLRTKTAMSPFNFMLDDVTKMEVVQKLIDLGLWTAKGTLSALIRVLLSEFAKNPNVSQDIIDKVKEEYLFTTKKNKRSSM